MAKSRSGVASALRLALIVIISVIILCGVASCGLVLWLAFDDGPANASGDSAGNGGDSHAPVYLMMVRDTRHDQSSDVGRTDSMALVRVLDRKSIDIVQLPRDLLVDIPACKLPSGKTTEPEKTKLNAAYAYGASEEAVDIPSLFGLRCSKETIEKHTGVDIAGSVVMDLETIGEVVDGLGDVELCVTADQAAGFAGVQEGCQIISGDTAVAFSQTRVGVQDNSDLSRLERQRAVVQAIAKRLGSFSVGDIPSLMKLVSDLGPRMVTDQRLFTGGNARRIVGTLKSGELNSQVMPVNPAGDGANLVPAPGADALWEALKTDKPLPN
ncbi:LCP family protein [Corynebacterium sp. TAE3-ERU12]|uniref:LCP family protein n=1 Tax=Corynebacterium sp. TAE3-ERU12 TaxID=2849491 RepID=UPI001C4803E6|nr:LCP family protein [Corynebacterium sp. TAE3-ERU12]MBV7295947.1 LCP family protein [Corynebacterium sp. TAE3-ERU12]